MRNRTRAILAVAVMLMLIPALRADQAAATSSRTLPAALEPLAFLLGTWGLPKTDPSGATAGTATFATSLQDRVIIRTSFAAYPATATSGPSRHDDLMIIYAAGPALIRADYFDNEGHVIRYTVTVKGTADVLFESDTIAGEPRYRLTYVLAPDGLLRGTFSIAPPGMPDAFGQYLAWASRKM